MTHFGSNSAAIWREFGRDLARTAAICIPGCVWHRQMPFAQKGVQRATLDCLSESRQCEGEHEDFPDDGQRAGMDEHRGEIVLRVERASLIEPGHGEHHLPIATAGKAYLRSTEARYMDASPVSVHIWMSLYDWMCMRGCGWQVTTRPIIDSLPKAISDLVNVCKGMVIVRESRCSFPWWKRGLGYDCQQGERDLQGGRRVGGALLAR